MIEIVVIGLGAVALILARILFMPHDPILHDPEVDRFFEHYGVRTEDDLKMLWHQGHIDIQDYAHYRKYL